MTPTLPPYDSAGLYDGHEAEALAWLARFLAAWEGTGHLPSFTPQDTEDVRQEALIALWEAAAGYGAYALGCWEYGDPRQPFADYARVQVLAAVKQFMLGWFADPDFSLLPDLEEHPQESVFLLWPDA